ncbi:MAG: hypothetical protein K1X81_03320 [Bacteroidia bacterium]|nr:hypothetical protein [Bacteroidia bacterium]
MRINYLLIFLVSFLLSCSSGQPKTWEQIKMSGLAYPTDSIVTDSSAAITKGKSWINFAYQNYAYRSYCPYHIAAEFNLNDSLVNSIVQEDPLLAAKLLSYHLKQYGVTHFAGQSLSGTSLVLSFYTEKLKNPVSIMQSFSIPCKTTFNEDPDWISYKKQSN